MAKLFPFFAVLPQKMCKITFFNIWVYVYLLILRRFLKRKIEKKEDMGKLIRSADKKIAGVCAGVAEHFGWNTRNVRLVWVICTLLGVGAPLIFYLLLWFLMPAAGSQNMSYEERMEKRLGRKQ